MMNRLIVLALVLGFALGAAGVAKAGVILLVSDDIWLHSRAGSAGGPEDDFVNWLTTDQGHTVYRSDPQQYRSSKEGAAGAAAFAADKMVDLIIVSRVTDSGSYNQAAWNDIPCPLLLMSPHLARSSRWKWLNTTSAVANTPLETIKIVVPDDPFVAGRGDSYASMPSGGEVTYNGTTDGGNGTVIATTADGTGLMLVKWEVGTEFYAGSGQTAGGLRVLLSGIPYHEDHTVPMTFDHFTENGKAIIAQTINTMIPEPATIALLGFGGLALLRRKRS